MPVFHIPNSAPKQDISSVNDYLQSDNPSFVLLYMDGCGPCSETHPQWKKMEKNFSDNENIGIFDIEMSNLDNIQHKNLTKDVTGFPTMRYVKGNICEDYEKCNGITTDRSYNSFLEWINKKNGNKNLMLLGGAKRKRKSKSKKKSKKKTRKSKKKSKKKSRKKSRKRSKKAGNHKKTSNLQAAEDDIIGLATDGLADGAAVAAV
jgi:thiol-disulfide isomerase/thioredoxin